jgi:hypothetical protein
MNQPNPLSYGCLHRTIFKGLSEVCAEGIKIFPDISGIGQPIYR